MKLRAGVLAATSLFGLAACERNWEVEATDKFVDPGSGSASSPIPAPPYVSSGPPALYREDLTLFLPLNEGEGATAKDYASGQTGVLGGKARWAGDGRGLDFSPDAAANGSWMDVGTFEPTPQTQQITISLWVQWKGPTVAGAHQIFAYKSDAWSAGQSRWYFEFNHNGSLGFTSGAANGWTQFTQTFPQGGWTHILATHGDDYEGHLYVDGEERPNGFAFDNSLGKAFNVFDTKSTARLRIGEGVNGTISNLKIYRRPLSAEEAQAVYDFDVANPL